MCLLNGQVYYKFSFSDLSISNRILEKNPVLKNWFRLPTTEEQLHSTMLHHTEIHRYGCKFAG